MAEEISFDDLGLTKSLNKMTAKELRALVIDKLPMITGASGMSKEELVSAINEVFGFTDEGDQKVNPYKGRIKKLKQEIKDLRAQKAEVSERKDREIIRRRINKLKKRTRRLANAV